MISKAVKNVLSLPAAKRLTAVQHRLQQRLQLWLWLWLPLWRTNGVACWSAAWLTPFNYCGAIGADDFCDSRVKLFTLAAATPTKPKSKGKSKSKQSQVPNPVTYFALPATSSENLSQEKPTGAQLVQSSPTPTAHRPPSNVQWWQDTDLDSQCAVWCQLNWLFPPYPWPALWPTHCGWLPENWKLNCRR